MKPINIIQIGDIHYPELVNSRRNLDHQDTGFPGTISSEAAQSPCHAVARSIRTVIASDPRIQGVVICGDLTDRGDLQGYRQCLDWLSQQLKLADRDRWPEDVVHAVPGNHDIDRKLCEPKAPDPYQKFEKIAEAWREVAIPILTIRDVRSTVVTANSSGVSIHSLNSCLGCGEYRDLPEPIVNVVRSLMPGPTSTMTAELDKLVYERLDTPAFEASAIEELVDIIDKSNDHLLPVVLAHHNVLPQGTVRLAVYTELINGGYFRRRLSGCNRPVLYLHGHIHDDPIEVVTECDGDDTGGLLVTVSAPQLEQGYNVLEITFGRCGLPIGCTVKPYRRQVHGAIALRRPVRIPLVRGLNRALNLVRDDDMIRSVVQSLGNKLLRLREVEQTLEPTIPRPQLVELLQEAHWLGIIIIKGTLEDPLDWHIQGVMP